MVKSKIIIELESEARKDLIEANGEEVGLKIEKELHKVISDYIEFLLTRDDFDYYVFDFAGDNKRLYDYIPIDDDSDFQSYCKTMSVSVSIEELS